MSPSNNVGYNVENNIENKYFPNRCLTYKERQYSHTNTYSGLGISYRLFVCSFCTFLLILM